MDAQVETRIVEKGEFQVIGMLIDCPDFDNSGVGEMWGEFTHRMKEIANSKGCWGISLPLPDGAAGFRYLACMEVDPGAEVPEGMISYTIPAAKYAVYDFYGHPEKIGQDFGEIYKERLGAAGLESAEPWQALELYHEDGCDPPNMKVDLYAAVK